MSEGRTLRIRDVGTYLGVSHQRADQMFLEGKFPKPERIDGIGRLWSRRRSSAGRSVSGGMRGDGGRDSR